MYTDVEEKPRSNHFPEVFRRTPLTKQHNCLLVHGILHRGQEREFPGVKQVDRRTSLTRFLHIEDDHHRAVFLSKQGEGRHHI